VSLLLKAPVEGATEVAAATTSDVARPSSSRWWVWMGAIGAIGLGIRLGSVFGRPNRRPGGDASYYHYAANLLVAGKGFIDPFRYYHHNAHVLVQSAAWPPGFVFVIAAASLVGFKSFFAHRIWCCIIGTAGVVMSGVAGREMYGHNRNVYRLGLMAAFIVAVYPNIWMSDEMMLSEALSPLLVATVLWSAFRFWRRPRVQSAVVLGATIGASALARDELIVLLPLLLIPLSLLVRQSWRRRAGIATAGTLAGLAVVAPWVGYNMSRFADPVFISTGLGPTLLGANCDATWSGQLEGYWSYQCPVPRHLSIDESVRDAQARSFALRYVRSHEGRLLPVELARLGRAFGAFHPFEQIAFDWFVETRPYHWALTGLWMYYGLCLLSVGGVVILRRRRVPVLPLLAIGLDVAVSVLITFGQTRYRTPFEVSLALMAAVQLEWLYAKVFRRHEDVFDGELAIGEGDMSGPEETVPLTTPAAV